MEEAEAEQIGHAAAFEAYRMWIHHPHLYENFHVSTEQRRESFIALAIAEGAQ